MPNFIYAPESEETRDTPLHQSSHKDIGFGGDSQKQFLRVNANAMNIATGLPSAAVL
jgi:hypothetical protein